MIRESQPGPLTVFAAYPHAPITYDNVAFYEGLLRQVILANRCGDCHQLHLPPQPVCPSCWSDHLSPVEVSGIGTVYMATELVEASGTRLLATVELREQIGLRFTAELVDVPEDVRVIGQQVQVAWRTVGAVFDPIFVVTGATHALRRRVSTPNE